MKVRRALSLLGICSGCVVIALVFSMCNSSLYLIQKSLNLSTSTLQWMMTLFGVVNSATLVTFGRLADLFGRKKVFLLGIFLSGCGMGLAGISSAPFWLILSMGCSGLGNAIILPISQAMLIEEYEPEERGGAISLWTRALGIALALGPIMGALIGAYFGWRAIFLLLVPVALLSFLLVLFFSRETKNLKDAPLLDLKGMFALALLLASFVLLLTEGSTFSLISNGVLMAVIALSLPLLVWIEQRAKEPILRPDLFSSGRFVAASLAAFALVFYIWALFFLLPMYLNHYRGLDAMTAGFVMLGITLPVSVISPWVTKRAKNPSRWIMGGFVFTGVSTAMMLSFGSDTSLEVIVAAVTLFGLGYAMIWGPSTMAAMAGVLKDRAGHVAGTFVTVQEIGGTLALAVCGTLLHYGLMLSFLPLLAISILGFFAGRSLVRCEMLRSVGQV